MRGKFSLLEVIVVIFMIGLLSSIFILVVSVRPAQARRTACASNLNQIGKALFMYEDVPANSIFPTLSTTSDPFADNSKVLALSLLYRGYIADPKVYSCPSHPVAPSRISRTVPSVSMWVDPDFKSSYGYDPGHSSKDKGAAIASDKPGTSTNSDNHGVNSGQNVLTTDGTVEWRTDVQNALPDGTQDKNIFGLNPEIPRKNDGHIRP